MNIEKKLLTKFSLEQLILELSKGEKQVFAPVKKNNIVNFTRISALNEMAEDYIVTVQSAKSVVFPRVEKLFEIETSKDNVVLKDKDIDEIPEIILLGTRPCDAAGFNVLYSFFGGDYEDNIFLSRLKKTTIISISCSRFDEKCFCTSLNVHPGGAEGSDILLTQIENGNYLAEIITEKGIAIVNKYPELFSPGIDVNKDQFIADVPVAFDGSLIAGKIFSKFEDHIWIEQSLRCIGCGTCAFLCPTCGCFDIQDEINGFHGIRKRSWDSCGFNLFTMHASGHNPRNLQSQRWRQRILHKFEYIPNQYHIIGCVGCGRCSRSCPVNMNIREHLINLEWRLQDE